MNIKLVPRDRLGEFIIEGKLDTNTAPEVEKIILREADRFDTVVLNFKELTYISSAGLRVLKVLHMAMGKNGGELVITNTCPQVMEVFEMTGFAQLLNFR